MQPRKRHDPEPRPLWCFTEKGKILSCPRGLPEGAVLSCREGDREWARADPAPAARPVARMAAPGLYNTPGDE